LSPRKILSLSVAVKSRSLVPHILFNSVNTFLILKKWSMLMRSRCCPCVCVFVCVSVYPPPLAFELLNQS
jgi:hypothetical protein